MALKKLKNLDRVVLIRLFLIIFFSVGVLGLAINLTRELFIALMPFSLLLGTSLMLWVHKSWNTRQVIVFSIIALLGFLVEVAGVLTGEVFGEYSYGRALGIKVWGTPPMIGVNWLMLIYCVFIIMKKTRLAAWLQIAAGTALMVVYDLIMEPIAIELDMWNWGGNVIPLQNYVAWFVISLVLLAILHVSKVKFTNAVAPYLFFIQMGFFVLLHLFV